jgi:mono/diheme cytochrome c family protein
MLSLRGTGLYALGASILLVVCIAICGCNNGAKTTTDPVLTRMPTLADAPAIYKEGGCAQCHGSMTGGGGTAPDLSHEGSKHGQDLATTVMWIGDQIRNPKSHNPNTKMPEYNEHKMAYGNAQVLATVLANQK